MKFTKPSLIPQPFKAMTEQRPWGYYGLYSENEKCTSKILYIAPQQQLSMQYHFKRDQFYLILDDDFIIEYSTQPVPIQIINNINEEERFKQLEKFLEEHLIQHEAKDGDMFGFHRLVVHRAKYVGNKAFGKVLDIAFGYNDEEDIVRIQDNYGRS